ncbi:MAG: YggS family pyridoxal phosphate-dependent enzyme [Bacteroidetes bacterium]|nr:YggS family pyridoxal phosphate-dependent enzyme [Bacteroidota bacterium]
MVNSAAWEQLHKECAEKSVTLIAVSKTKPTSDIEEMYQLGQRDFGENYVQELVEKEEQLPKDIRWHYIGHLQSNKVKYIAAFVHLIHAVDSFKLLLEIDKQAAKNDRVIDVLLQMHIADEETKFGMDERDLTEFFQYYNAQKDQLQHVRIRGLMGMATNTDNEWQIRKEFRKLHDTLEVIKRSEFLGRDHFDTCSIGMSSDYKIAIEEGGNMIRVGSLLFGERKYH